MVKLKAIAIYVVRKWVRDRLFYCCYHPKSHQLYLYNQMIVNSRKDIKNCINAKKVKYTFNNTAQYIYLYIILFCFPCHHYLFMTSPYLYILAMKFLSNVFIFLYFLFLIFYVLFHYPNEQSILSLRCVPKKCILSKLMPVCVVVLMMKRWWRKRTSRSRKRRVKINQKL